MTDDDRDALRREFEQKSSKIDGNSISNLSAVSELNSCRLQVDKLAHQRALRLDTIEKKQETELKVIILHIHDFC